ncbi:MULTISPECIES: hypothetical protein [unclassified Streptomyces]|uniref:Uncharacterized protein n=1 Tax=Streptomyces sp. NBC_00060 TaxID=2975636 RepID=A0AAU2H9M2_9ACTN
MPSSWSLPEPTLAAASEKPKLPPGYAAEPKWDDFRALASHGRQGRVRLRSRSGGTLADTFAEIVRAAAHLPQGTVFDRVT